MSWNNEKKCTTANNRCRANDCSFLLQDDKGRDEEDVFTINLLHLHYLSRYQRNMSKMELGGKFPVSKLELLGVPDAPRRLSEGHLNRVKSRRAGVEPPSLHTMAVLHCPILHSVSSPQLLQQPSQWKPQRENFSQKNPYFSQMFLFYSLINNPQTCARHRGVDVRLLWMRVFHLQAWQSPPHHHPRSHSDALLVHSVGPRKHR